MRLRRLSACLVGLTAVAGLVLAAPAAAQNAGQSAAQSAAQDAAPPGAAFPCAIVLTADVTAAEESTSTKREAIAGVGLHAAFVPTSPQTLAVVHRPDGVVRIVANGLAKAQTIAIAKAVATP